MKKRSRLLFSEFIAGFTYYEGPAAFYKLRIGRKLALRPEKNNRYDENAVAVYLGKFKLVYIPRSANKELSMVLRYGYNIFEVMVQQIQPDEHPEQQVRIGVYVRQKK